jgi:hypothetical protein
MFSRVKRVNFGSTKKFRVAPSEKSLKKKRSCVLSDLDMCEKEM